MAVTDSILLVAFTLGEQRYALHLSAVERVLRVVEVTTLPKAPEIVLGVIDVKGKVVPVVNICRRFRLPERETALTEQIIMARSRKRTVALIVDSVLGPVEVAQEAIAQADRIVPGLDYLDGIAQLPDGMVLIHDLDRFLSLEEEEALDASLSKESQET